MRRLPGGLIVEILDADGRDVTENVLRKASRDKRPSASSTARPAPKDPVHPYDAIIPIVRRLRRQGQGHKALAPLAATYDWGLIYLAWRAAELADETPVLNEDYVPAATRVASGDLSSRPRPSPRTGGREPPPAAPARRGPFRSR